MDLKTAIKNLQKDRYVSSMMAEELSTVVKALDALQTPKAPEVPVSKIEEKLIEALAMLKGDLAQANSKSAPKGRKSEPKGAGEPVAVAAKAKS